MYWIHDPLYVAVGITAAMLTFGLMHKINIPRNFFLLPDAIGLALFTVIGTSIAMSLHAHWFIAALMGVITGVFGGVIRDILCNEVPLVLRTDIYATASLLGALLLVGLDGLGLAHNVALILAMLVIIAIRLSAIRWHIHLPRFRAYE